MGILGKKYTNSEEIFADITYCKNRKRLEAILYKMVEDGVDDENFEREDLIVLEAMHTLTEKVDYYYIGGVAKRLKTLLLPLLKNALKTKDESKYIYHFSIRSETIGANLKDLYNKLLGNRSNFIQEVAAVAAILAYTQYRWQPDEAAELLSEISNLDDREYYSLIEAAIRSAREEQRIKRAVESIRTDLYETEEYSSSDDDRDEVAPQLTRKQIAARKRLRKGTAVEMPRTEASGARASADSTMSARSTATSSLGFATKPAKAPKKPGKALLVLKIFFKSLCVIFGAAIILLALFIFFATEGQIPEDQRVSTLIGHITSGAFCFGLWLFYYGTIVALKKAGIQVRDDLKDPSFWEIVSVTTVTTEYSDGSREKKTYSNMRGSFIGEIVIFLVIFTLIQTYYFIASPVLGIVSLARDIKSLKEWNK